MKTNEIKKEVSEYYSQVTDSVDDILKGLAQANESNDEELSKLVQNVISDIEQKNVEFKKTVEQIEKDSEFDKFTIAFFGATNAGKSTIIEALRILFDEKSRRAKILQGEKEFLENEKVADEKYQTLITELKNLQDNIHSKKSPLAIVIPIITLIAGFVIGFIVKGVFTA